MATTPKKADIFWVIGKNVTVSSNVVQVWKEWQKRDDGWTLQEMAMEDGIVYCDTLNHADDSRSNELFYKETVVPARIIQLEQTIEYTKVLLAALQDELQ